MCHLNRSRFLIFGGVVAILELWNTGLVSSRPKVTRKPCSISWPFATLTIRDTSNDKPLHQFYHSKGKVINEPLNGVELAVVRWSAWAPGLSTQADWEKWAAGKRDLSPRSEKPDVSFVPAMLRRRLSSLSRMVFHVATACLDSGAQPDAYVYSSRYGEYERSFGILSDLARQEAASPAAFSHSVHNTSASLFSIDRKDPAPYTALAAGAGTLESAFLEAWSLLKSQEAGCVLLVHHDEPLPPLYKVQTTNVTLRCALALVLQLCETDLKADQLQLSWQGSRADTPLPFEADDPVLRVLQLLISGGDPFTNDTGRLVWSWTRRAGTA